MNVTVETERDVNLLTGQEIVRVKYRPEGVRKWTRLLVVPDSGQTVDELLRQGHEIAAAHMARAERHSSTAASCRLDRPPATLGAQEDEEMDEWFDPTKPYWPGEPAE